MKTLAAPQSCWHESLLSARTDAVVAVSHDSIFVQTTRPLPVGTRVFVEWMRGSGSAPLTAQLDAVVVAANTAFTGFRLYFTAPDVSTQMALRDLADGRAARLAPEPIDMLDMLDERRIRTSPLGLLGLGDLPDNDPSLVNSVSVLEVSFDDVQDVLGPTLLKQTQVMVPLQNDDSDTGEGDCDDDDSAAWQLLPLLVGKPE
jgi:hypothetical protein